MKFRAIQNHTEKDRGHFISVDGAEAHNGPFELIKQTKRSITGLSTTGQEAQFDFTFWQIVFES